eukprot:gb/GECH01000577.1/.p1 GENE.gb/GECH01000577.1/~~gb/GECH01000577.1/.p1  ORF type:complete len:375 (+),score=76.20 gb/GECH01000577.1/:1-1125(+)
MIVLDSGSGMLKIGYAGDNTPLAEVHSVIGRPKYDKTMMGLGEKEFYVGVEAQFRRGALSLRHPVEHGVVTDWDDMQRLLHDAFYIQLRRVPEEYPVLITEAIFNPKTNREQMAELMFETFDVPELCIANTALLSLLSSAQYTGLVLESGDGVTSCVPIHEWITLSTSSRRWNFGGSNITEQLTKQLNQNGINLISSAEREIVRDMKEKKCYVAYDFDTERKSVPQSPHKEETYRLPDGELVPMGKEKFECPEIMFQPHRIGLETEGISSIVHNSIQKCNDHEIQKQMRSNIILSGGNCMFKGMKERLKRELRQIDQETFHTGYHMNITSSPYQNNSAWVGGSILASLDAFSDMFISKNEYQEHGPLVVHHKCL